MNKTPFLPLAGLGLALLAGCAPVPTHDHLPPVEERGSASPYRPPPTDSATPRIAAPVVGTSGSAAVVALMNTAAQQRQAGDSAKAAATLERALRIESDNATLWHSLAQVRLQQQRWAQAEQIALKSNRLAGRDKVLQAANWRLIATARDGAGESEGSRAAQQRAAQLEP